MYHLFILKEEILQDDLITIKIIYGMVIRPFI